MASVLSSSDDGMDRSALPQRPSQLRESPPPLPPRQSMVLTPPVLDLEDYVYMPIKSSDAEIRVLTLEFNIKLFTKGLDPNDRRPIKASLSTCFLPLSSQSRTQQVLRSAKLPVYEALSYVWGDDTRTDWIIIDGKKLGITRNLYRALRDMQRENLGQIKTWADAVCINQGTDEAALIERSEQIMLMRQVYRSAAFVKIWLGTVSEEGKRCMRFMINMTARYSAPTDEENPNAVADLWKKDGPYQDTAEKIVGGWLRAGFGIVRGGYAVANAADQISDIIDPVTRDHDRELVVERVGKYSLHDETIEAIMKWKPAPRYWKNVQHEDFPEIARLIDKTFLQDCEWFSRMWVVQEVAAGTFADVLYNGDTVTLEDFLRCVCYLHYHLEAPVPHIRRVIGMEKIRMSFDAGKRQSLRDLLHECRYRKSQNPQDKIYALHGIMGDKRTELLKPDLKKSVGEVYSDVAYHWVTEASSLDPLCGWQSTGRIEEVPSWAPDFTLNQDLAPSPLVMQEGSDYNASGHDHRSKYRGTRYHGWAKLHTNGLCIDYVSIVSDSTPGDQDIGTIEKVWLSTVLAAPVLREALTAEVLSCLNIISDLVEKCSNQRPSPAQHTSTENLAKYSLSTETLVKANSLASIFSKSTETLKSTDTLVKESTVSIEGLSVNEKLGTPWKDSPILDAYLSTLLLGRISPGERLTRTHISSILALDTNNPSPLLYKVYKAIDAAMQNRKIGITSKGYLGTLPEGARPGDFVCVLFGCSLPVVLRLRDGKKKEYQWIGECYLHGYMDAEAIVGQVKGELKEEIFVLR